jgi:hypothetical protein
MKPLPQFFKWLVFAALADWLIARTVSRSAIFMPKSPAMIAIYEGLTTAGLFAATLGSLLALGVVGWIAWNRWRESRHPLQPALWASLLILSVAFLFVLPLGGLALGYYGLLLIVVLLISKQVARAEITQQEKVVRLLPALALVIGALYQILPALYEAMRWPGPPVFSVALFNAGELVVVLCPFVWWWVYGRGASWKTWVVGSLPALAFAAMRIAAASMTGTIAIWSVGLTLYLPWPLYALSLWLLGVTIITLLRRHDPGGWAFLLLATSGFAPQLSTHLLTGLIALWLLTWSVHEAATVRANTRRAGRIPTGGFVETTAG